MLKANDFANAYVNQTCIIEDNVEIGEGTLIGPFCFIRSDTVIGKNCKIGPMNVFEGSLKVGNNVRIGTHCNLGHGIIIEDYVFLGGLFTGANDKTIVYARKPFKPEGYTIKFGARIGLGVIILPGVTVGKECLVGAGSLVTKDVKDYEIVYGHPARHHGWVDKNDLIAIQS